MELTILGCNAAIPTTSRNPSAQVLVANGHHFLIDCGEGTQFQLRKLHINFMKIEAVFISHMHGDHVFGLFPLLSTLGLYGRQTPLKIYAPRPFGEILEYHLRYFDSELPYAVEWEEVATTEHRIIFENRSIEVWSIPLRHRLPTAGYMFREKMPELNVDKFKIARYGLSVKQIVAAKRGKDITLDDGTTIPNAELTYLPRLPKSYAYCSDTNRSAMVARRIKRVDLLYHEATYAESERRQAKERGHSTARQAAEIALKAEAGHLLIGHFSSRYKDTVPLLDEARAIFAATDTAIEGQTYTI